VCEEQKNIKKNNKMMVDALYDKNCFLIANANADFSDIYTGEHWKFEFQRTISRITEMSQL
jgi:cell division protein ZapE